jgi:hypothetical protein
MRESYTGKRDGRTETSTPSRTTPISRMRVGVRVVRVGKAETRVGVLVCHVSCVVIGRCAVSVACHVFRRRKNVRLYGILFCTRSVEELCRGSKEV